MGLLPSVPPQQSLPGSAVCWMLEQGQAAPLEHTDFLVPLAEEQQARPYGSFSLAISQVMHSL